MNREIRNYLRQNFSIKTIQVLTGASLTDISRQAALLTAAGEIEAAKGLHVPVDFHFQGERV